MKEKKNKIEQEMNAKDESDEIMKEEAVENSDQIQSEEGQQDKLMLELDEKTKQYDEVMNRLMRLQADFDNYKKRVNKEREEMYTFALEGIVASILPVLDNIERAVNSFKTDNLDAKYVEGIEIVQKQLISVLEKSGVKEIESTDCEFDPNKHHAVMQCEASEDDENKIKLCIQKGYILGNKVIRPSLVQVAIKN